MNDKDVIAYHALVARRAVQLQETNATLPFTTAFIMASDAVGAEDVWTRLAAGRIAFPVALAQTGSYARMDLAYRALDAGYATEEQVLGSLPELWRGSDPDDEDGRFLDLWLRATLRNGGRYLRDGAALPRGRTLTVFRGQDPADDPAHLRGIAWSLDVATAEKFARGAWARVGNRRGVVYEGRVPRDVVLGYLTGRGESEVVVDPWSVTIVASRQVRPEVGSGQGRA